MAIRTSKPKRNAAPKPLAAYTAKRDFTVTAEPPAAVEKRKAEPIFVIQQHAATRLHWDFRLEAEGVLKSWAVTKEPTLDPAVRRLAVHVEDHPLAYASFHGDIPDGQYGAGHVDIWDHGTFTPKPGMGVVRGLELGHVEVDLHGSKLNGMFALIRMGEAGKEGGPKENWLLLKMKDDHAKPGTAPPDRASYRPKEAGKAAASKPGKAKSAKSSKPTEPPPQVEFTHVDKVMFPDAGTGGLTKADLIRFYIEIAPHLIPHLKDRPITLERLPDGLTSAEAPRFWQKNTPSYYPSWIPRANDTDGKKRVDYTLVNDEHVLAYLVNQGAVTFHPFLSRVPHLDQPDFVVFDLDPGPARFSEVVTIAQTLHALLGEQKIEPFVKTSGKSGLHVTVPWTGTAKESTFDAARAWATEIADELVRRLPNIATTERSKAARGKRVYVDVVQNGPGKHVVPAYVVRAVPAATVSCPLDWDEVTAKLNPAKFTTEVVLKRVKKIDPSLPLLASKNLA